MNETLTFVLQLKELMSGGLAKIASTAQTTFNNVDVRLKNTQSHFTMVGKSVEQLNARLTQLTQKRDLAVDTSQIARANREIQLLENRIERLQNRGRVQTAGGTGGLRLPWWLSAGVVGGMALTGLMGVVKTGADQQRDIVGLSTFMGKQNAQAFYGNVQKDARITPFVTHDLMAADRMLISTGMSADKARHDIMNLANAIAATGGGNYQLERMAQHLQMIRGMGHASYMQLKEFTTNGINIMQLLSDATGKHMKMAHGMTVSYNEIAKALEHAAEKGGLFYGALQAQSQTIWGKWSTLVDDLQISAGKIVTSQSTAITGLLDLLDKYAMKLPEIAEHWAPAIAQIIKGIISLVGYLIDLGKWLFHNWSWFKYVVGVVVAFKAALAIATTIAAAYNSVMVIAAARLSAFAVAEGEATTAAIGLSTAMEATPWGALALGVAGVGVAITALISQSKNAGNDIVKNLTPSNVIATTGRGIPTQADFEHGLAVMKPFGGYRWKDYRDMPLTAQEQARLDALGGTPGDNIDFLNRYGKRAMMERIMEDRRREAERAHLVVNLPAKAPTSLKKGNDDENSEGDSNSDAIIGGGRKNTTINVGRFSDKFEVHVGSAAEGAQQTKERYERLFLEVLNSAKQAL